MDKFLGVLQSDAEAEAEASRSGKQSKLEQMLQAQMLADIMRANNNLKALKNFRVNNDKLYRDKAAENAHRKEIREPLDNALNEIDLLNSKVERRDEMIRVLRRQLYTELLRNMQGSGSSKSSSHETIHDLQAAEEMKVLTLTDQSDRHKQLILAQQQQITKIKRSLAFQVARVKELYTEIEAMEFAHAEHLRKAEADNEIYMGMVDSRDTKIEKLIEDKDELQESLQAAEETIATLTQKGELKKAQQRCTDLESRLKEAESVMSIQRERFAALDVEHQQLQEENAVMKDKQEDLQGRYDSLIVELDQMVEEGYYIPNAADVQAQQTPQETGQGQGQGRSTSKSLGNNNDASQQLSSSQVHTGNKRRAGKGVSRNANAKKLRSANSHNQNNTTANQKRMPISMANGVNNSNTINELPNDEDNNDSGSVSSLDSNLEEQVDDPLLLQSRTRNNSATSQLVDTEMNASRNNKRVGRFALRRQEEDSLLAERLQANAALRQKDTLLTQIQELSQEITKQKTLRQEETKKANLMQDGLQLGQRILTGELNRMGSKLQDLEHVNSNLREELQLLKTTNSMLQQQVSSARGDYNDNDGPGKLNRRKSSLYQRLSQMVIPRADPADLIAEAALRAELRLEAQEEQAIRLEREKLAQEKLQLQQQHALNLQLAKEEEEKRRKELEEAEDDSKAGGLKVDMLQYMYAWENVHENSRDTQTLVITDTIAVQVEETDLAPVLASDASQVMLEQSANAEQQHGHMVDNNASQAMTEETRDDDQSHYDGDYDDHDYDSEHEDDQPQQQPQHDQQAGQHNKKRKGNRQSHREHRSSTRDTSKATSSNNSSHLTPSQLLLVNKPFEELFQGLSLTISSFLPPHKLQLLYPASHTSQLSIEEVIAGLDIEWQVKHGLALLAAVNELRNAFVRSHLPADSQHTGHGHHEHRTEERTTAERQQAQQTAQQAWYDQLPPGVAPSVRCLDLILQSLHHLLSPLLHLQRSTHPELLHLFAPNEDKEMEGKINVIRTKMFPPDLESRKPFATAFSSLGAPAKLPLQQDDLQVKQEDEEYVYLALSSAIQGIRPAAALAFPLTEPRLSADYVRGAPRGALSPDHPFTTRTNSSRGHSSGMSMLPRKLPRHVDQLLDLIEKESRMRTSRSPSPSAFASHRPNTAVDITAIMIGTDSNRVTTAEEASEGQIDDKKLQTLQQEYDQQQELFGGLSLASEGIIEEYRHSLTLDPPPAAAHSNHPMSDSLHEQDHLDPSSLASSSFAMSNYQYRSSSPKQPPSIDSSVERHLLSQEEQETENERERQKRAAVSFTIDSHLNTRNEANNAVNSQQGAAPSSQKGLRKGSLAHLEQSMRPRFLWPTQANNDSSFEFVDFKRLAFDPQTVPSLAHPRTTSAQGSRPLTSSYQPATADSRPRTSNNNNNRSNSSNQQSQQASSSNSRGRPSSNSATIQPWRRSEMTHQSPHPPSQHTQADNNNTADELLLQANRVARGQSAPQQSASSRQRSQSPPSRLLAKHNKQQPLTEQEQSVAQLYSTSLALSSSIKYGRIENDSGMEHQLSIASQPIQPLPRPTSSAANAATASNVGKQQQAGAVMTVTINPAITAATTGSEEALSPQQQQPQGSVPAPLPPQPETSAAREMLARYLAHTQRDFNKQYCSNNNGVMMDPANTTSRQQRREKDKAQGQQQLLSPRQPSRPSNMANPPVTKFYSPRVARHLLLPGTGKETPLDFAAGVVAAGDAKMVAAAVDLRDTAVMLNALDDHRIFPSLDHTIANNCGASNSNRNEVVIMSGGDRPGSGLVILGNKSKPAASREKVTGSFLFM